MNNMGMESQNNPANESPAERAEREASSAWQTNQARIEREEKVRLQKVGEDMQLPKLDYELNKVANPEQSRDAEAKK